MKFRKIIWMLTFFVLAGTVAACGRKEKPEEDIPKVQNEQSSEPEESTQKEEEQEKEVKEEPEEPEEKIPADQNLLTGVPDLTDVAIGKRPVAVMVNNVSYAMPQ